MKTYLLTLLLLAAPASAFAADDCAKNADACSGGGRKLSPFVEASLSEMKPAAVADTKKAELKQPAARAVKHEPAPEVSTGTAASAAPAAPAEKQDLSSPLWLVFVGGSLAGLYLYLGAGRKRSRRK